MAVFDWLRYQTLLTLLTGESLAVMEEAATGFEGTEEKASENDLHVFAGAVDVSLNCRFLLCFACKLFLTRVTSLHFMSMKTSYMW